MTTRTNKIEPDELDLLLNEAERGVAGTLLRSVNNEIEPRAEFAQELEARLLASTAKRTQHTQPVQQPLSGRVGIMDRLKASFSGKGIQGLGRIAPVAFGGVGVAAMVLLFVGMASMLNLREQASQDKQTPTAMPVEHADILKLIPQFELLHTLPLNLSIPGTRDIQMAWSPRDNTLVAQHNQGGTAWDGETGEVKMIYSFQEANSMVLSPDGHWVAMGSPGGVQLYSLPTGKGPYLANAPFAPGTYSSAFMSMSWSPDSKYLATAAEEPFSSTATLEPAPLISTAYFQPSKDGVIRIWDVATGLEARAIKVPGPDENLNGWVSKVAWSHVGNTLAVISSGGVLRLWDASTGEMLHYLSTNPMYDIAHVEWSPNGRTLAVVALGQVQLWDAQSGKMLRALPETMTAMPTPVPTVTASADGTVPMQPERSGSGSDYFGASSLLWSPDSTTLITADGGHIRLWDPTTGQVKLSIADNGYWLALSPDGRVLASAGLDDVVLREVASGEQIKTLTFQQARVMAWSATGNMLALSTGASGIDAQIAVWGVRSAPASTVTPLTAPTFQPVPTIAPTSAPDQPTSITSTTAVPTLAAPIAAYATPAVGQPMPDFASVDVRTGQTVTVSSLRGKPLVLTFWGTWCPPCRNQMPGLQRAFDTYGKEIQFLNVTLAPRDTPADVLDFITKGSYTSTFTHADTNPSILDFVDAVPATYFLDKDGIIKAIRVGAFALDSATVEQYMLLLGSSVPPTTVGSSTERPMSTPQPTTVPIATTTCRAWSIVDSPNVDSINELTSVTAISPNDVWAVGYHSIGSPAHVDGASVPNIEAPLTMHWDGKNWRTVDIPNLDLAEVHIRLTSVSGAASNDVWAVGYYVGSERLNSSADSTTLPLKTALILHWNGQEWYKAMIWGGDADPAQLNAVFALSREDIWAVGRHGIDYDPYHPDKPSRSETLILHTDGQKWFQVTSPSPAPFFNELYSVSASSSDDVWAVGVQSDTIVRGGGGGLAPHPLALHWDGKTWSVTPVGNSPSPDDTSNVPLGVAATSGNEVYAVGGILGEGGSDSIARHWDGTKWTQAEVSVPKPPESSGPPQDQLSGVTALSKDNVWAVGTYIRSGAKPVNNVSPLVMHWDGKAWSYVDAPDPSYTVGAKGEVIENIRSNRLSAIAAAPNGDLWAVGSSSATSPTGSGSTNSLIMRYSAGPCSTPTPTP
jgi:WD40 repeat protein/thiol-disulfide isomerase/thioredoxin